MMHSTSAVGLVQGTSHRKNVYSAMQLVREEIAAKIGDRVLVKPNFLSSTNQLASSHPDALRGVLDFLMELPSPPSEVIVAEGANEKYSGEAFEKLGFIEVVDEYPIDIRLVDTHQTTKWIEKPVLMVDGSEETVRLPAFILEHPCTLSLAVAKTHDGCVVTLGLKNIIMGSIHKPDRIKMHGYLTHSERVLKDEVRFLNANLARIAKFMYPDIAVIDGTRGLQGNGPGGNDGIDFGVAAASSDVYAADAVMAKAMGFDPATLAQSFYGDLTNAGISEMEQIEVRGVELDSIVKPFKPHDRTEEQLLWADERMTEYVAV